jgi:Zn-dependent protease
MKLFTYRGIPIRLHSSFLALAALLILIDAASGGIGSALGTTLLGIALFGSVLLHELGHALAARRFGIDTRSITLYPFGGIAALSAEPRTPRAELWIALAGPAVNFALAAAGAALALLGTPLMGMFVAINLALGLFNLLPAFPMDGGRVLRAGLTLRMGRLDATKLAIQVSRWFAWGFIGLGLLQASFNLLLVGGFLLFALNGERRRLAAMQARQALQDARNDPPVQPIMQRTWAHPTY